jgi:hypothetical protein
MRARKKITVIFLQPSTVTRNRPQGAKPGQSPLDGRSLIPKPLCRFDFCARDLGTADPVIGLVRHLTPTGAGGDTQEGGGISRPRTTVPGNGVHPFERGGTRQRAADGAGLAALGGRAGPKPRSRRNTPATTRRWANPTGRSTATAGPTQGPGQEGRRHEGISRFPHRGAAELRPTLTTRPPRLAGRLTPLVAAPSHHRHGPAAGFHAGLVPSLAHPLRAAMGPRLRAGCPLLGRRLVVGHSDGRDAERRDEDSSEQQTSHHVSPQMAARPKSYIRKQAPAKFKRRARNDAACAHSWRANVALGVRLDSDLAALGSDFGRNVTLTRFQTRSCCAKHACCITVQHHDRPESW